MKNTTKKFILIGGFILNGISTLVCNAQVLDLNWENNPSIHEIKNKEFLKESAIVILDDNQLEVVKNNNGDVGFMRRIHKIVRVNDEKGIEMYNKSKIEYNQDYPISLLKARSISPLGKVTELSQEAFKDVKNENGTMEKLFAFEGVEIGSEIEYVIFKRQRYIPFGIEVLQDQVPTIESHFELISPSYLVFDVKGYNNVKIEKEIAASAKNSILCICNNLPGLEEEKYATYFPHFARVEYSIAFNTKVKEERLFTWDDLLRGVYTSFTTYTDKQLKAVRKILESNKDYTSLKTTQDKIFWIENFLKTNYVQQEYVDDEHAEEIEFILKNKFTNESGMKNLFACCFVSQKIPFDIGYTTNRFRKRFDASFINAQNMDNFMFYFPETKQYLAPNETYYRSPLIPSIWCGQDGIFSALSTENKNATVNAETRKIPEQETSSNFHNHDVIVTFNDDIDVANIEMKQSFGGYNAQDIMPVMVLLENEKREDIVKGILAISNKEEKIDGYKYTNNEFASLSNRKPLIIEGVIHSSDFIEKAGSKYLLKVGTLIGPQSEMYQEKPRQFDLEIPHAHQYTRTLTINIPEGYKINNLDKLKMNIEAKNNGKESCKFISDYTINNEELKVNVFEIYHNTFTPKSEYEAYRKVINAAADFNKIVVVMEKK